MNKYEELFNEILTNTKNSKLTWTQLRRNANSEIILHPNTVVRQFSTTLERNNNIFTALLVEKKMEDPEWDYAYDKYQVELLILDEEGEMITSIDDTTVERSELLGLVSLVETKSDKAKKLFG